MTDDRECDLDCRVASCPTDRSCIAYPPGPYYAPLAEFDADEARRDVDTL